MAERTQAHRKIVLNPIFSIPEGAEDEFTHDENANLFEIESEDQVMESESDDYAYSYLDETSDDYEEPSLEAPQQIAVISQKLRRGPGGQNIVDVVIEISDVEGATGVEIKYA